MHLSIHLQNNHKQYLCHFKEYFSESSSVIILSNTAVKLTRMWILLKWRKHHKLHLNYLKNEWISCSVNLYTVTASRHIQSLGFQTQSEYFLGGQRLRSSGTSFANTVLKLIAILCREHQSTNAIFRGFISGFYRPFYLMQHLKGWLFDK